MNVAGISSVVVVVLVLVQATSSQDPDSQGEMSSCPQLELKKILDAVRKCQETADKRFLLKSRLNQMCRYLEEVSKDCTRQYNMCYSDRTSQNLRDLTFKVHLDRLRKIYGIGGLDNCDIVKDYQKRTNDNDTTTFLATDTCSQEEMTEVVNLFKRCGSKARVTMGVKFRTMDSSFETQKDILCNGLSTIMSDCYSHMTKCLDANELKTMRRRQLDFLGAIFYHVAGNMGFSVRQCNVFDELTKVEQVPDSSASTQVFNEGIENSHMNNLLVMLLLTVTMLLQTE